jgi:L-aspartate oxidase
MWEKVGLLRDGASLAAAVSSLEWMQAAIAREPADQRWADGGRRSSLATVGWLMARAAWRRTESRGGHFRSDFPQKDDVHFPDHLVEQQR